MLASCTKNPLLRPDPDHSRLMQVAANEASGLTASTTVYIQFGTFEKYIVPTHTIDLDRLIIKIGLRIVCVFPTVLCMVMSKSDMRHLFQLDWSHRGTTAYCFN